MKTLSRELHSLTLAATIPDSDLLRDFAEKGEDAAFAELVRRRIDFVYAAALRQVHGDAHLARDVAQCVFVDLARKASGLSRRSCLAGWLYTSTRFAAAKMVRSRTRRIGRDQEVFLMNEITVSASSRDPNWDELRPVLDEAMHELAAKDRDAILLRFFEGRSLAEVGSALGLGENTARMRVERALEKLRVRLGSRGITSTAAALGAVLAAQPSVAAPAGLAASVAGISLAQAAVGATGLTGAVLAILSMKATILTLGTAGVLVGFGLGVYVTGHYAAGAGAMQTERAAATGSATVGPSPREENARLKKEVVRLNEEIARERRSRGTAEKAEPVVAAGGPLASLNLIMALQSRDMIDPQITFVSDRGRLDDAFTELFALTGAERERLQATVDRARERLGNLEREHAVLTKDERGHHKIAVKAFPEAGGAVYDELMKSFADTLGSERNDAYKVLGASQVERALGGFGAPERTYVFQRRPAGAGGKPYSVLEARMLPQETNSMGWSVSNRAELARRLGPIADLLPADF